MDAFSLLNFWRNAGGDDAGLTNASDEPATVRPPQPAAETKDEADEEEDSFFDLEFTVPDLDDTEDHILEDVSRNLNGIRSSFIDCSIEMKRRTLMIEQSPILPLKSPPKPRECVLGFQRSEARRSETHAVSTPARSEEVSIGSLFQGDDNSLRSKMAKQSYEDDSSSSSSKRFPKDVVRKYLKLIKPLYVRVSKRYSERTKSSNRFPAAPFSSPATAPTPSPRRQVDEKQGSRAAALRVACRHLGKSRSASSAVRIVPSPATGRRDDSLLQQHDGIQSAILHCKRSFSSSRESSFLARSASDNRDQKSISSSNEEQKRRSI